jgi:hypothetical protein
MIRVTEIDLEAGKISVDNDPVKEAKLLAQQLVMQEHFSHCRNESADNFKKMKPRPQTPAEQMWHKMEEIDKLEAMPALTPSDVVAKRQELFTLRGDIAALEAQFEAPYPAPPVADAAPPEPQAGPVVTSGDRPAPLATAPAWSPITALMRAPGYRWPLYQLLKEAHTNGRPCPKAREVLEIWKLNTPPELEVMTDGVKYSNAVGNTKEADLKAIQQAFKGLLKE